MSEATKLSPQLSIKLLVQKGPHHGQRFVFSKGKITIGRSPENDIVLVNDPLISRQHAYIQISNNDVEIVNLSTKNPILVNNENVNKWKLTHDTIFMIGDTEFLIQIENQQSVVVMKPSVPEGAVSIQPLIPKNNLKLVPRHQKPSPPVAKKIETQKIYQQQVPPQFNKGPESVVAVGSKNKIIFYIVLFAIAAVGLYFYLDDSSGSAAKKSRKPSTLKYSDEIALKLDSPETTAGIKKQEDKARQKQSSVYLRAEENFSKGIRAFQLGSYASAIEFFQLTLTTNSEHVLAKRYLYLSKVRFDEMVKAKLDLGQSYFERNNFKLCISMFQQVIDMLSPKEMLQAQSKDTNLQLARVMLRKCEFAAEGIH
jgi:pSer/pThr/pTyr-binding forkhead associated (FHA) protein